MKTITIANRKGGTGKTTTAAFLAHALAMHNLRVAVFDADPQESLARWAAEAEWEIPVDAFPSTRIHLDLRGIVGDRFDLALIDTPGFKDKPGIFVSAIQAADMVVVPMSPTMMDLEQVPAMVQAIEEVAAKRGRDIQTAFLLNRTIPNAVSTEAMRGHLQGMGHTVLGRAIPRREGVAQALGLPVNGAAYGHLSVAEEIMGLMA